MIGAEEIWHRQDHAAHENKSERADRQGKLNPHATTSYIQTKQNGHCCSPRMLNPDLLILIRGLPVFDSHEEDLILEAPEAVEREARAFNLNLRIRKTLPLPARIGN